jgi:hypothetical protein
MTMIELITAEMNSTKDLIAASYKAKGLKASGKFERDLEVVVEEQGDLIKAKILGSYHSWFMIHGRNPNKEQTSKAARGLGKILEQWVKDKGIDVNPYDGRVIEDVATDSWLNAISNKVNEVKVTELKDNIKRIWQL